MKPFIPLPVVFAVCLASSGGWARYAKARNVTATAMLRETFGDLQF